MALQYMAGPTEAANPGGNNVDLLTIAMLGLLGGDRNSLRDLIPLLLLSNACQGSGQAWASSQAVMTTPTSTPGTAPPPPWGWGSPPGAINLNMLLALYLQRHDLHHDGDFFGPRRGPETERDFVRDRDRDRDRHEQG